MKRRTFLKTLIGLGFLGGSGWAFSKNPEYLGMLTSALTMGGKSVDNWRATPAFRIESFAAKPSLRFFILGDWGTGGRLARRVAKQMALLAESEKPHFIMSTGDNIYPKGVVSAEDPQWQSKFEKVFADPALNLPWYAVLGNHDHRLNPDAQIAYSVSNPRWHMPDRHYKFSWPIDEQNKADFFALDTQLVITGDKKSTQRQTAWLAEELAASEARWKIVFGHHMIRSHGVYGDMRPMIRHFKPLLDKYKADIYINGHDHDLQYLQASEDHFRCLISGAGGGARNTAYGKNSLFAATNGGFVYLALTPDRLYTQFVAPDGRTLFADSMNKKV